MSYFAAKMHQIRFRLVLRPRPRWGSLQRSPRPPPQLVLSGPTSKGRGGKGGGGGGEGKGGGGMGGKGPLLLGYTPEIES